MPQFNSFVLTDAASTPVAHTFIPDGRISDTGFGKAVEYAGVPMGRASVTVGLKLSSGGIYTPQFKLAVPVVATQQINGVDSPVVVDTSYLKLECNFSKFSTEQQRKNIFAMGRSAMDPANPLFYPLFTQCLGLY